MKAANAQPGPLNPPPPPSSVPMPGQTPPPVVAPQPALQQGVPVPAESGLDSSSRLIAFLAAVVLLIVFSGAMVMALLQWA